MRKQHHTLIDVGSGAIDRVATTGGGTTLIDKNNAANVAGILDSIQLWFAVNATGVKIGVFYLVSGTTYHCRSAASIGSVTAGSVQTFTGLNLAIQAGDFLGIYYVSGNLEVASSGGSGLLYKAGDYVTVDSEQSYTVAAGYLISIYGTGADPVVITTTTLPDGQVGTAYSQSLVATGGATPYTWTLASGALPDSLNLSSAGVISGTPTVAGTFNFTVKAKDSLTYENSDTQALTIIITSVAVTRGWWSK